MNEIARRATAGDPPNRDPHDWYRTPPIAIDLLLAKETFLGEIWEPACGDGALSQRLLDAGHDVMSTDLIDRGYGMGRVDFLTAESAGVANVVTNPPYKIAEKFARKALDVATNKVALLLKLQFLETPRRKKFIEGSPLARVYVFPSRLTTQRGGVDVSGTGLVAFAWFVWRQGYRGAPELGFLDSHDSKER